MATKETHTRRFARLDDAKQSSRFIETAEQLGSDSNGRSFDKTLESIAEDKARRNASKQ